jgi:hypothetical protein
MAVLCVASDPSAPRRISQVASSAPCDAPTSVAALTQMKEAPSRLTEGGLSDPKSRLFRVSPFAPVSAVTPLPADDRITNA